MNTTYYTTIGLEVHAELKTKTKMFCDCINNPDEERPNVNICPICMGHPGTLPVVNKEAVRHILRLGHAVKGKVADFSEFDRKNYFYPDIPKGYQISQYKYPLIEGGELAGVALTRIHVEEDTGSSLHDQGNFSLVNFNRAGVPLMELVTEPVIHDAKTAVAFAKELQLILRYLGAGEANLEKGEMRVEANISISADPKKFGTKVEVKNLNSFRSVEKAITYELARHASLLDSGESVVQETRGWDDATGKTFSQRKKEDSHDYRYFPDPDIPKFYISELPEFSAKNIAATVPELPEEKRLRYSKEFGIKKEDIEVYVASVEIGSFFETVAKELKGKKEVVLLASNYIVSDLLGLMKTDKKDAVLNFTPIQFTDLILMVANQELSSRGAKTVLAEMYLKGGDPKVIAEGLGVVQKSDIETLKKAVLLVIEKHPEVVADFKGGKQVALQFLLGQSMKETKGAGNPSVLKDILLKELS